MDTTVMDVPVMTPQEVHKLLDGISRSSPVKIAGDKALVWSSICSMHFWHDPECPRCVKGFWREVKDTERHASKV